ncbi:MAG: hypothetical protein WA672_15390 [Candidatus Angelobacter sp.]
MRRSKEGTFGVLDIPELFMHFIPDAFCITDNGAKESRMIAKIAKSVITILFFLGLSVVAQTPPPMPGTLSESLPQLS